MKCWALAASFAVFAGDSAVANDSTATVGAGGLILQKTGSVAMVSEELFVSVDQIRVAYRFRNISSSPVRTIVAFPMPPRRLSDEFGGDIAFPSAFRTLIDGRRVNAKRERKALVDGKDYRRLLESLKIPVAPSDIMAAIRAMDRLPSSERQRLIALKIAGEEQWDDDGKGMKSHLIPLWSVADSYWWTQIFLPGKDVLIDHAYKPGAGGSVDSAIASPAFRTTAEGKAMIADYCIDRQFLDAVEARAAKGDGGPMMPERRIDYILTTGGNWAKPIGTFKLTVDKGKPGNLVSFCGDGIQKVGPTRFSMVKHDWRPTRDLRVLILEPRH